MGFSRIAGVIGTRLGLLAAVLVVATGCVPCFDDTNIETPAPDVDFAKAHRLAKALFDVSFTTTITDEQLSAMYKTDDNEVLVRSTIFPGDTTPSRYMYVKDNAAKTQMIYLSGTNSETLWAFDFDLSSVWEPDFNSPVHRGFNNAALTVLDDVLGRLETDYPTTVTGYSLGGAMATLLAQYLVIAGYDVVDVVTFGQPKITDGASTPNFMNLPVLRFVNRNDPVPHLPPDDFTPGQTYAHFGPEVILYDGPYYSYMESGDASYARATDGNLVTLLSRANFDEHGLIYVQRLEDKLTEAVQIPYVCTAPAD